MVNGNREPLQRVQAAGYSGRRGQVDLHGDHPPDGGPHVGSPDVEDNDRATGRLPTALSDEPKTRQLSKVRCPSKRSRFACQTGLGLYVV